jgi:DUF4097 and DUF4098 domain-containing protein YvlB
MRSYRLAVPVVLAAASVLVTSAAQAGPLPVIDPCVVADVAVLEADQVPPPPPVPPVPPKAPRSPRWSRVDAADKEQVSRVFKVSDGATFVLSNLSGDISVTVASGNEIKVDATKYVHAGRDTSDAKQQLADTTIEFEEHGGRIEVRAYPVSRTRHMRVSVDFSVSVPPATAVSLRSVSGDISIADVKGEVTVEAVSGDITASNLARPASIKTVSGDVALSNSWTDGRLGVNSVSGDVVMKMVKARTLEAGSVSGDVRWIDGGCERGTFSSVSGNIDVAAALAKGGRYAMKTHSGNVKLALDGKIGFALDASTFSGSVKADFPITLKGLGEEGEKGWGPRHKNVTGVYGDGSAAIEVSSFSGNVVLVKKP